MMDQIFSFGNLAAMLGWIALAASLFAPVLRRFVWPATGLVIPALFGAAYLALLVTARGDGGFGSIAQVRSLFADDHALTAGWFHYLAFDLFVGTWIARDGMARALHPLLLVPCLFLTFMVGPVGLLIFLALRSTKRVPAP